MVDTVIIAILSTMTSIVTVWRQCTGTPGKGHTDTVSACREEEMCTKCQPDVEGPQWPTGSWQPGGNSLLSADYNWVEPQYWPYTRTAYYKALLKKQQLFVVT